MSDQRDRSDASDDEKIAAIHNYVVKNTRYLHVGLGIHGWKPYRTTTCFRNRYGDCKDKATLLIALIAFVALIYMVSMVRMRAGVEAGLERQADDTPAQVETQGEAE